jgi:catechol 2,3-dioxygenase-like lactoylglutathione lyase family enzyme
VLLTISATCEEVAMLDHVALNVRDLSAAKAFYLTALEPLGYSVFLEEGGFLGLNSPEGEPDFWLGERGEPSAPTHVAFRAPDRATVDAFHAAALAAGGTDNGAPGVRPDFHESYYAAFVLDPEGNNIEAVCQQPA